jgi:N-acetylmuramoyl-L-alanine amidase
MLKMKIEKITPAFPKILFRGFLVVLMMAILPAFNTFPYGRTDLTVKKVIIDAGHGGRDPGNLGTGRYRNREKDIALKVALLVGKYIKENLPDVEVIYTRKDDTFVELRERTAIANRAKADMFISIHCDAFTNKLAMGSSTYVMGKGREETNLRVAMRENSVIMLEENYMEKYEGFDPSKPETYIALSLYQNVFIDQSITMAQKVQDQFRDRVKRKDRGVKQQPLWVTSQTIMPSILIELGFLTNHAEEDFLNTDNGKELMASAIYRAFKEYKLEKDAMEKGMVVRPAPTRDTPNEDAIRPATVPVITDESDLEELVAESPQSITIPTSGDRQEAIPNKPVIKIQIATSTVKRDPSPANFRGLQAVSFYQENRLFKYVYGSFYSLEAARESLTEVRKNGFPDAFLVAFHDGKKIPVPEAVKKIKEFK